MLDSFNLDQGSGVVTHAGFPNAGSEASGRALDLQQLLVPRPVSTFLFRVSGNTWARYGIFDGDIAVIDRALAAASRDLVIWWQSEQGEFALSRRRAMAAGAEAWGCVTSIIHLTRRAV